MNEHDTAILICPVHVTNILVPVGTKGTIMFAYSDDGRLIDYLLELRHHKPVALLDVEIADVKPAPPPAGNWLTYLHRRNAARRARRAVEWGDLTPVQRQIVKAAKEKGVEIPPEALADTETIHDWTARRIQETRPTPPERKP